VTGCPERPSIGAEQFSGRQHACSSSRTAGGLSPEPVCPRHAARRGPTGSGLSHKHAFGTIRAMRDDVTVPSHDELVRDLRLVRERGLGRLRRYAVPALRVAAQIQGLTTSDEQEPAAIETVLRRAVALVGGGRSEQAAELTLGLAQGTKLWSATDRRRAAARAQGVSVERFRKGYEPPIVELIAENVLVACRARATDEDRQGNVSAHFPEEAGPQDGQPASNLVRISTLDDAGDFSLPRMLNDAVALDMLSRSLVNLMNQYATQIARIVQRGGIVRAVILKPLPALGKHLYPLPSTSGGDAVLRRHTAAVAGRIRYIESLTVGAPGSFEVRTTRYVPQYGMVTAWPAAGQDPKAVVQLNFLFTRTERDRPLICLDAATTPWFGAFNEEFEKVWADSEPWVEPNWANSLSTVRPAQESNANRREGING
jgi:hypothetical protein